MSTTEDIKEQKMLFVSIVGLSNAGKSTLLNSFLNHRLSIVTPKKHTTRTSIRGILTHKDTQIVFIDTPGLFKAKRYIDQTMIDNAICESKSSDINLLLVDAKKIVGKGIEHVIKNVIELDKTILVINKIDIIQENKLLELVHKLNTMHNFKETFLISALKGKNINFLIDYLLKQAFHGEWIFKPDQLTDAPLLFLAAEITREKLFLKLRNELPYNLHVVNEKWDEKQNIIHIYQAIYVVSENHKMIVVGKKANQLKQVGIEARLSIEKLVKKKICLNLFVKIYERWQENSRLIQLNCN